MGLHLRIDAPNEHPMVQHLKLAGYRSIFIGHGRDDPVTNVA